MKGALKVAHAAAATCALVLAGALCESYTLYDIEAGDDLHAFAAIARQKTLESYGS